jgi:glucoamylase
LATTISALVAGAALLPSPEADWALALADFWNANIEAWLTVSGTELGRQYDVPGYYVRVAPPAVLADAGASHAIVPIRNRRDDTGLRGDEQIGTEFLYLVRAGLRRADDPLILGSLRLADALLKTDTPNGPVWHRYLGDGYGEHDGGSAYDGTGIGRGWPLLIGERGHYELCAGNDPLPYLAAMAAMASPGGMIPEQVWDDAPIPSRRLVLGRPTGAAMPLAWAHAEFVKLMISRGLGHPTDRPWATWLRYHGKRCRAKYAFWFPHAPIASIPSGARLVVGLPDPARIRWGVDGWNDATDQPTGESGLGFFVAGLDTAALRPGQRVEFTVQWAKSGEWLGRDISLVVRPPNEGEPRPA